MVLALRRRDRKESPTLRHVVARTGSGEEGGKFLLHVADGFYEKDMDKDESARFWFHHVF